MHGGEKKPRKPKTEKQSEDSRNKYVRNLFFFRHKKEMQQSKTEINSQLDSERDIKNLLEEKKKKVITNQ